MTTTAQSVEAAKQQGREDARKNTYEPPLSYRSVKEYTTYIAAWDKQRIEDGNN